MPSAAFGDPLPMKSWKLAIKLETGAPSGKVGNRKAAFLAIGARRELQSTAAIRPRAGNKTGCACDARAIWEGDAVKVKKRSRRDSWRKTRPQSLVVPRIQD